MSPEATELKEPKLYLVNVTVEREADVYVWATTRLDAERIAKEQAEVDDFSEGYRTAYGHEVSSKDVTHHEDWSKYDSTYGEPPEGVGDSLGEALDWVTRTARALREYEDGLRAQQPLFEGVAPQPLPCDTCGQRYPAELHLKTCPEEKKPRA